MKAMAASEVWIRRMRVEDIPRVHEIDVASFALPWPESSYRFEIEANPSAHLWVAEKKNDQGQFEIVGMIVVWLIIDEAHIATFAVHPAYRRFGIGQRLLAQALLEMHRMGLNAIPWKCGAQTLRHNLFIASLVLTSYQCALGIIVIIMKTL